MTCKNVFTVAVGMATGLLDLDGGPDHADAAMHNLAAALLRRERAVETTRYRDAMGGSAENVRAGCPAWAINT